MKEIDRLSRQYLDEQKTLCAYVRWTFFQRLFYAVLFVAVAAGLYLDAYNTWIAVSYVLAVFFCLILGVKLLAFTLALIKDPSIRISPKELAALRDDELPVYSIMVPLYREPGIIDHLLESLDALDYPQDKLDVQILVEPDDAETREALAAHQLPGYIRIAVSPPGIPRTKPRACNAALEHARGEFLVVYDAEDRPEPDQLKKAVLGYREVPYKVVCLQARLAHYNSRQGIFAQWAAMEYLIWYQLLLPGLQLLRAPIPLGGTSNHFRIETLRKLGGWDPFNVTEDCDLGMRIARQRKETRMLDSTTWEECVTRLGAWIRQRSRWIKGYWQTWMVHSRRGAIREFGLWPWLVFSLFVGGGTIMFAINPILWGVIIAWLLVGWPIVDVENPLSYVMLAATVLLMAANVVFLLINMLGCLVRRRSDLVLAALLSPLEWILFSVAALKALMQFITSPFHWEKTEHGHAAAEVELGRWGRLVVRVGVPIIAFGFLVFVSNEAISAIRTRIMHQIAEQQRISATKLEIKKQLPSFFPAGAFDNAKILYDFEEDDTAWRGPLDVTENIRFTSFDQASQGEKSLRMELAFPGDVNLVTHPRQDWSGYRGLALDCYLPLHAPRGVGLVIYLRDRDDLWHQQLSKQALLPGRWTRIELDFDGQKHLWRTKDHAKPWDGYTTQRVNTFGFQFVGKQQYTGPVFIDNIRALPRAEQTPKEKNALTLTSWSTNRTVVPRYEKFELTFELSKTYDNPFDPDEIDIQAEFTKVSGGDTKVSEGDTTADDPATQTLTVPAFYYQNYARRLRDEKENIIPMGSGHWMVRFAPPAAGDWEYSLLLYDRDGASLKSEPSPLKVTPSERKGYVRVSKKNPAYFEFDNGEFFYPIGHHTCYPVDIHRPYPYKFADPVDNKSYTYDTFLEKMAANGENWTRIWTIAWGLGLEGRADWSGYHGVGRYSQQNSWRLDHVLENAESKGIYMTLTMTHKSAFKRAWVNSPYNVDNGGFLKNGLEILTDPRALDCFQKRLRYMIARWGYSQNIMAWELHSEVNLVPGYSQSVGAIWHKKMSEFAGATDPFGHLVFAHTHDWRYGTSLWPLPGIKVVQSNGYVQPPNPSTDHVVNFRYYLGKVAQYDKPKLVAEYGGTSEVKMPSGDYLEAQLHSGLWASVVHPFGGAAMCWWWNFIEGRDLYHHYGAFSKFCNGVAAVAGDDATSATLGSPRIDRLAHDYQSVTPKVAQRGELLQAAGMQAPDRGFYWIYQSRVFSTEQKIPGVEDAKMIVSNLALGDYWTEYWDTRTGEIISRQTLTVEAKSGDGRTVALVRLPTITRDLAIKIHPQTEPAAPTATTTSTPTSPVPASSPPELATRPAPEPNPLPNPPVRAPVQP